MAKRRAITVVVPVYGDLPSLLNCITSLIATVDSSRDSVLIVNDCGPNADELERELLSVVGTNPGFRYERNTHNLGFVGTCNRAALELDSTGNDILLLNSDTSVRPGWLDELGEVLHEREDHGIVCARSNNATIASLPFRLRDPHTERSIEYSAALFSELQRRLPRYSYPPVAMGFCFLVRRELVTLHGLFDVAFSPGYGEENDFCLRMGRLGFRSVMAHRVLVEHEGARSFQSARRARLRAKHEKLLVARHPDYTERVRGYLWCEVDPVDAFADVLTNKVKRPHLAFFAHRASQMKDVMDICDSGVEVTVVAPDRRVRRPFARSGITTLLYGQEEGRVWDAAFVSDDAQPEARMRAGHSAPRVTNTSSPSILELANTTIDDADLRHRWSRQSTILRSAGIPRPPRQSMIRGFLQHRARWTIAPLGRVTNHFRKR